MLYVVRGWFIMCFTNNILLFIIAQYKAALIALLEAVEGHWVVRIVTVIGIVRSMQMETSLC